MKLFEIISENFFSILASKNKEIYVNALMVLRQAFKQDMSIRKDDLISLLIANMEDDISNIELDEVEDNDIYEKGDDSISSNAHYILRRLKSTGWIELETRDENFQEYVTIPSYAIKVINLLYALINEEDTFEYNSYVYSTYSSLKLAITDKEQIYTAVITAYTNTINLLDELKTMYHHLSKLYKEIEKYMNIKEVLIGHFEKFKEYADRNYHPLKTLDTVPKYKIPIINILNEEILGNTVLFNKMIDESIAKKKYNDIETAKEDLIRKINEITMIYENIDKTLNEIEDRNNDYICSSNQRIQYFLSSDRDLKGKIINILKKARKDDIVIEKMKNSIDVCKQEYVDYNSLYTRSRNDLKEQGQRLEVQENNIDITNAMNDFIATTNKVYTTIKVMNFMKNAFGEKKELRADEMLLKENEDFLMLIYAVVKQNEKDSFYKIRFNNNYIIKNGFRIPEMIFIKRGEKDVC